jgi:hypothetical protein
MAAALVDAKRGHRVALEALEVSNKRGRALIDALRARAHAAKQPVYRAATEVQAEDADVARWVARALG